MVDSGFLVVVAISVCLLTGMVVIRLAAGGETTRRIVIAVVELWLAVALWIGVFWSVRATPGAPGAGSGLGELGDLPARLEAMPVWARAAAAVGSIASVALAAHLMRRLRCVGLRQPGPRCTRRNAE